MGALLRFYLGREKSTTRAFWLGASRVLDARPVLSGPFAVRVSEGLALEEATAADAWNAVGEELREVLVNAESDGQG